MSHYLALSAILFFIGVFGVLFRRNLIVVLMSIELMLNAVNLSFVTFARYTGNVEGHVAAFFIMALAAAEAALGLAILVMVFRNRATVQGDDLTLLRY
ncbi:MAG: NADH-quinone oxidoreductase subunit NuoK [Candidatus Krumholzibacteriota bacterium]|nr:NADH-quinone oxidoreductase subunit NuoK [Candidatus Krumholzibacteriota bacterium]